MNWNMTGKVGFLQFSAAEPGFSVSASLVALDGGPQLAHHRSSTSRTVLTRRP